MREILVVDDDRLVREGLRTLLEGEGYAVRTARDGVQAVAAFAARRPALVLMDVMMPMMDGLKACGELRRLDAEVPIVLLTARDGDEDQVRGLDCGADDFIPKSTAEPVLLARLRAVFARTARLAVQEVPRTMRKAEGDLYRLFKSAPGRVFSHLEICEAVGGKGYCLDGSTVRSHMKNLRRKLPSGERIFGIRGVGYGLEVDR